MPDVPYRPPPGIKLVGITRVDYFHIECERCDTPVVIMKLWRPGGVPQMKIRCPSCREVDELKLDPSVWAKVKLPSN